MKLTRFKNVGAVRNDAHTTNKVFLAPTDQPFRYDMALVCFCMGLAPMSNWLSQGALELLDRFGRVMLAVKTACGGDPVATGNYFNDKYHALQLSEVPSLEALEFLAPLIEEELKKGLVCPSPTHG